MKAALIIFTIYFVVTNCYHFPDVTIPKYYVPIVNFRGINASIVFVRRNNSDNTLIKSIVTELYSDQTVILARGPGYETARRGLLNKDPNVIVVTRERISVDELNTHHFEVMLQSYWSPLYLVLTDRNGSDTCKNGNFSKSFLVEIEKSMNHIWHRYRVVRIIVSFPFTCPYHFIIYGENKKSNAELYDRTIKIINANNKKKLKRAIMETSRFKQLTTGYPLRANIFERFPTSITSCDKIDIYMGINLNMTRGLCGLDGLIMHEYIHHYKFNLLVPEDETCDIYGFEEPDTKRMTGSLGCIIDGKIDISFNSRFMVQYTSNKNFFYLHYITIDSLVVLLKLPEEVPLWHYTYNCFGPRTGFIINILILLLGVVNWASAWILREIHGVEPRSLYIYVVNAFTCTMFGFPIKQSNRFRVLRGTSLFCSIILLAFYQGNINYRFTTRTRYLGIKTLNQLYHSGNTLHTSPSILNLLISDKSGQDIDQQEMAFLNRTQIKNESLGIGCVLESEHIATISRGTDVVIQVLLNFTDNSGSPLMYFVDEPLHLYYVSYICRTGFLFTEETLRFMMRLLEAGLPKKYYIWTRRTLKLGDTYPKTNADPRPTEKITLPDLRLAFSLLSFGCLLSTISFVIEVYKGQSKKKYIVESRASSEIELQ